MLNARPTVANLLPLLTEPEKEFVLLAVERSLVNLKMRLTDWAANHADAGVRAESQNTLNALNAQEG